jgi:hypothetical protein
VRLDKRLPARDVSGKFPMLQDIRRACQVEDAQEKATVAD